MAADSPVKEAMVKNRGGPSAAHSEERSRADRPQCYRAGLCAHAPKPGSGRGNPVPIGDGPLYPGGQ